jgi:hypothetical protein
VNAHSPVHVAPNASCARRRLELRAVVDNASAERASRVKNRADTTSQSTTGRPAGQAVRAGHLAANETATIRRAGRRDEKRAEPRAHSSYAKNTDTAAARIAAGQDLRSPDTRDIADGREYPPVLTVVTLKETEASKPVSATESDWLASAAGAAAYARRAATAPGVVRCGRRDGFAGQEA